MRLAPRIAVVVVLAIIGCLGAEAGARMILGIPMLDGTNFRNARFLRAALSGDYAFDRTLGWVFRSGIVDGDFGLIDHGIRRNGSTDVTVRRGGALAVGDSFTASVMLSDEDTWPAMLETELGMPVVNGAVGRYGVDQIVLRAEALLPIVLPRMLLVQFSPKAIDAVALEISSAPKPFFVLDASGAPVLANPRVPLFPARRDPVEPVKRALGYSTVLDNVLAAVPNFWMGARRAASSSDRDPVAVTCGLLHRLKAQADSGKIQMLGILLYGSDAFAADREQPTQVVRVGTCMRAMGIDVVDSFAAFRSTALRNPDEFRDAYTPDDPDSLSEVGNQDIAGLVLSALGVASVPANAPR
jgi:hypothetical protein